MLDLETREFLRHCLDSNMRPLDPQRALKRMSLNLDLTLCWARRISIDDPLFDELCHVEHEIVNLRNPITNYQDCHPFLRHIWSRTSKRAIELRQHRDNYFHQLNKELDERLAADPNIRCFRADLLRNEVEEPEVNLVCLSFLSAGMAPTVCTLQWTLALLSQRPDIQKQAYQELTKHYAAPPALGSENDDGGCAYIVALIKECLRYVGRRSLVWLS